LYSFLSYSILLFLSATASLCFVAFAWPRKSMPGAVPYIVLMFASALWSASDAFEMMGGWCYDKPAYNFTDYGSSYLFSR